MLDSIRTFFSKHLDSSDAEGESHDVDTLHLASAALMFELCRSDQSIDESETLKLAQVLETRFSLPHDKIEELMELAHQESMDSTSLYQFTSLFNEHYNYEDKLTLLSNLWEVAFADGQLDRYEEHLIRQVADLLYLSHSDFIKTKLKVKAQFPDA